MQNNKQNQKNYTKIILISISFFCIVFEILLQWAFAKRLRDNNIDNERTTTSADREKKMISSKKPPLRNFQN